MTILMTYCKDCHIYSHSHGDIYNHGHSHSHGHAHQHITFFNMYRLTAPAFPTASYPPRPCASKRVEPKLETPIPQFLTPPHRPGSVSCSRVKTAWSFQNHVKNRGFWKVNPIYYDNVDQFWYVDSCWPPLALNCPFKNL